MMSRTTHLQDQINDGYGLIFVATHGNQTIWGMETGANFGTDDALGCTNSSRQGIIYTMACNTNAFDQELYTSDPCLSEAFLRNSHGGAVAFIGSSRYGWGYATTDIEPAGTSIQYAREFFHHLFDESAMYPRCGQRSGSFGLCPAPGSGACIPQDVLCGDTPQLYGPVRWLQFALNLMGDPYLKVMVEDPEVLAPVIDTIDFDECISELGTSNIIVTAN